MSEVQLLPSVRDATKDDAVACAAILNDWIDATAWMPRVHAREDVERYYTETVMPERRVMVAGDPVEGFLALDADTGFVTAFYVGRPGCGIGKALLDLAKSGVQALELWTFQANTRARRFYAREGFREIRRTDGDNEEALPDVLLRWERRAHG